MIEVAGRPGREPNTTDVGPALAIHSDPQQIPSHPGAPHDPCLPRLAAVAVAGLTLAAGFGLALPVGLAAAEPSWEGKTVLLTRAGVRLQAPEGQDIDPKTPASRRT